MKTIKHSLYLLFFVCIAASGFSQTNKSEKENKKALRVAIITERVGLTEEESKAFWPVYDQMQEDIKTLRQNFKGSKEKGRRMDQLSDEEVDKIIMDSFDFKQKELDLKKQYHIKFKAILPIKKVAKLYHVERQINREVNNKMENNPPRRPVRR